MRKIRVLVADDHTMVRKGLCSLLSENPGIEVVEEAADGREAIAKAAALLPDVVLMDITMPHLNGLEATRQIKRAAPQVKVIALTMYTNEEYILQILQAGASGYVVKQAAPAELISAIETVHDGGSFLSPSVSQAVINELVRRPAAEASPEPARLTDREREVLQLIAEGFSNREIAERLQLSIKTVGVHRVNLMDKLGAHNVTELVKYALRKGIINLDA